MEMLTHPWKWEDWAATLSQKLERQCLPQPQKACHPSSFLGLAVEEMMDEWDYVVAQQCVLQAYWLLFWVDLGPGLGIADNLCTSYSLGAVPPNAVLCLSEKELLPLE